MAYKFMASIYFDLRYERRVNKRKFTKKKNRQLPALSNSLENDFICT